MIGDSYGPVLCCHGI